MPSTSAAAVGVAVLVMVLLMPASALRVRLLWRLACVDDHEACTRAPALRPDQRSPHPLTPCGVCGAPREQVIELDTETFDDMIDGSKPALVFFYAPVRRETVRTATPPPPLTLSRACVCTGTPWCACVGTTRHLGCTSGVATARSFTQSSTPWQPASSPGLSRHTRTPQSPLDAWVLALVVCSDGVVVAKVDATVERELAKRYNVRGYPTVKWFAEGDTKRPVEHNAGMEAIDLLRLVNRKTGERGVTVPTVADVCAPGVPAREAGAAFTVVGAAAHHAGTRRELKSLPSAVVELTPDTFDGVVLDESKHVMVEFFAPWCGHCKKLAPDYERVGRAFADEETVRCGPHARERRDAPVNEHLCDA